MDVFYGIMFVLVGGFFIIGRFYNNYRISKDGKSIVEKVKQDINFKQKLVSELGFLYSSKKYGQESGSLQNSLESIQQEISNKKLIVEYVGFINNNCLLIVKCFSKDYDVTADISLGEVTNVSQFNFLVKKNENNQTYEIYSNAYADLADKFLRMEVANKILEKV